MTKKGVFVLEQPRSSLLYRHPRFQELCRLVKVTGLVIGHKAAGMMHHGMCGLHHMGITDLLEPLAILRYGRLHFG